MVFSSGVFMFLFLPALLILYYSLTKSRTQRNYILLLASLAFYSWGEPVFVFVMIFSVFVNWLIALMMTSRKKFWLVVAVTFDVALLGVFKYAGFVTGGRVIIRLPIGISFFTFQMMSYVFDVYYGTAEPQRNFLNAALYISFFPQLIAGPIVRYNQIAHEITNRTESYDDFSEGVRRFIYGLGKKILLANFTAQIADNVFGYMIAPSVLMSWLGAVAYTLQIYFDFSGYSDMAVGLGLMFGFHFEENFRYPYTAKSISEFWRRWHISLSSWFRDYVYIPMGGNRVSRPRWVLNVFVVWLLTGIWHGANWTFILWGLLYFVLLAFEKFTGKSSRAFTLLMIILAWVIFRSDSVSAGMSYIASMFGLNGNAFCDAAFVEYVCGSWVVVCAAVVGCLPVVKILRRSKAAEGLWLCAVLGLSLIEIVASSYNPFIYFNF